AAGGPLRAAELHLVLLRTAPQVEAPVPRFDRVAHRFELDESGGSQGGVGRVPAALTGVVGGVLPVWEADLDGHRPLLMPERLQVQQAGLQAAPEQVPVEVEVALRLRPETYLVQLQEGVQVPVCVARAGGGERQPGLLRAPLAPSQLPACPAA